MVSLLTKLTDFNQTLFEVLSTTLDVHIADNWDFKQHLQLLCFSVTGRKFFENISGFTEILLFSQSQVISETVLALARFTKGRYDYKCL